MKVLKEWAFPKPLEGRPLAEIITNLLKETPLTVPHLAKRPEFQKTGQARHGHIAVFMHVVRQYRITAQGKMRFKEANGVWQCSYAKLADDLGISKPRARRIVKDLHEGGLIEIKQCTVYNTHNPIPYVTFLAPVVPALKILGQEWAGDGPQVYWSGRPLENRKSKLSSFGNLTERLFSWDENLWGVWTKQGTPVWQKAREVCAKTPFPYTVKFLQTLELQSGSGLTSPKVLSLEKSLDDVAGGKPEEDGWLECMDDDQLLLSSPVVPTFDPATLQVALEDPAGLADPPVPPQAAQDLPAEESPGWTYLCRRLKKDYVERLLAEEPERVFWKTLPVSTLELALKQARQQAVASEKSYLTMAKIQLDTLIPRSKSVTTVATTHPTHSVVTPVKVEVPPEEKERVAQLFQNFRQQRQLPQAKGNPFQFALQALNLQAQGPEVQT